MEKQTYSRRLSAFASATMISRILGYVRDALVASYFGGGALTDAFYAAFKVPNLFRRFLGEGALTAAFVPVFTVVSEKEGKEEANRLFNALFYGLCLVLVVIVALGVIFAPQVAHVVAWGFERDSEKMAVTIRLIRLTFPFLLLVSVAALLTAVLNSSGRFFIPAVAPSGLSIAEIGFVLFVASQMEHPIYGLAISALVGGFIHFGWQLPLIFREGYSFTWPRPFDHPEVKSVLLLMVPTIIGLCGDQFNSFVDQLCASFLRDGSITALYNSNRVMQLPLALFGVAVSSVSLPALAKHAGDENMEEFKSLLGFSLRIANFILIPSLIGLCVLGLPIIQLLFQHGRFTPSQSLLTYAALLPYSLGLPAYSAVKILATSFYAQKDTRTPVKISLISVIANVGGNIILMRYLGVSGLALATAVSAWIQVLALVYYLRRKIGPLGSRGILKSYVYSSVAGMFMGIICYVFQFYLLKSAPLPVSVFGSLGVGVLFYFSVSKALKIEELSFVVDTLLRRRIQ